MEQTRKKVIDILKRYISEGDSLQKLNDDTHLINELNINSMRMVDIIIDTEEEFDIEIKDEELDKLERFKDFIDLLHNKMNT